MVSPAMTDIARDLKITTEIESEMTMSIFVLAYAVGPLFLGPLSEIYGRSIVLQSANMVYLVFNIACSVARNKGEMIAFRFLAGLGGSAPLSVSSSYCLSLLRFFFYISFQLNFLICKSMALTCICRLEAA